ncbi:hypothetical protein L0Y41_00590 [bacterium]|nr:hypothetical protein [bacterium]
MENHIITALQEETPEKAKQDILDAALREGCTERGLNMGRVQDFFENAGLQTGGIIFPDEDQFSSLARIIRQKEGFLRNADEKRKGFLLPKTNLTVVIREKKMEEANGPIFTESIAVHELAHSTGNENSARDQDGLENDDIHAGNRGFRKMIFDDIQKRFSRKGYFFEEAFAEICRVEFLSKCPIEEIKKMTGDNGIRTLSFGDVPSKYFYKNVEGKYVLGLPAVAAASMEKLLAKTGGFSLLLDARAQKERGRDLLEENLRHFYRDDTFTILDDLKYNREDFLKGFSYANNLSG